MVVDDIASNRRMLAAILKHSGHKVVEAQDGSQAIDMMRIRRPDVVVTDLLMPVMDGYELVRTIREDPEMSSLPVIFFSGHYLDQEARSVAGTYGVDAVLTKPARAQQLVDAVDHALKGKRSQGDRRSPPGKASEREHRLVLSRKLYQTIQNLEAVDAERRQLLSRVLEAAESERRRIAADIHDDTIQVLGSALLRLEVLRRRTRQSSQLEALAKLEETIAQSIERLRSLIFELRPAELDSVGVGAALRAYVEQCPCDAPLRFFIDDDIATPVPPELSIVLFRIAQEALTNVRKHAQAARVRVRLGEREGGFYLSVTDDGVGFDSSSGTATRPGHLGLTAMRERAELVGGWCRVRGTPTKGCIVEAWVPASTPALLRDRDMLPARPSNRRRRAAG
jgi:signal transduction histidine kinase